MKDQIQAAIDACPSGIENSTRLVQWIFFSDNAKAYKSFVSYLKKNISKFGIVGNVDPIDSESFSIVIPILIKSDNIYDTYNSLSAEAISHNVQLDGFEIAVDDSTEVSTPGSFDVREKLNSGDIFSWSIDEEAYCYGVFFGGSPTNGYLYNFFKGTFSKNPELSNLLESGYIYPQPIICYIETSEITPTENYKIPVEKILGEFFFSMGEGDISDLIEPHKKRLGIESEDFDWVKFLQDLHSESIKISYDTWVLYEAKVSKKSIKWSEHYVERNDPRLLNSYPFGVFTYLNDINNVMQGLPDKIELTKNVIAP